MKNQLIACAILLYTIPTFAIAPAWCGRYLQEQSIRAHAELNEKLDGLPYPQLVYSYAQGTTADPSLIDHRYQSEYFTDPAEIKALDTVVNRTEEKIESAALEKLVESLYVIFDSTALPGSHLNLTENQIPNDAANLLCDWRCSPRVREHFRLRARTIVHALKNDGVKRKSLDEVLESLKLDIGGLNDILAYKNSDGESNYFDYRQYYLEMLKTPEGSLLLAERIQRIIGTPFSIEDMGKPHLTHSTDIDAFALQRALGENYLRIQAAWSERRQWLEDQGNANTPNVSFPREKLARLQKLALLLVSAPYAVAEVFKGDPTLLPDLCWMLRDVDWVTYDQKWKSSVSRLSWYIAPLEVAVVAGMFLTGGGVGLVAVAIAAIALKGLTGYQVYQAMAQNYRFGQAYTFHRTNIQTGLSGISGLNELDQLNQSIRTNNNDVGLILATEFASFGAANIFATRAEKLFKSASSEQKFIWLNRLFSSTRGQRTLIFMHIFTPNQLRAWMQKATPEQIQALLFHHKDFGFGKTLLLTEGGIDVFQEALQMSNEKVFEEINPFEALLNIGRAGT